jgi:hypothetical protein
LLGGGDLAGFDLENAKELIRTINALKLLLKPASDFKQPEGPETKEAAN